MNNGNKSVLLLSNRVRDGKMLQSGSVKTAQRVPPFQLLAACCAYAYENVYLR